MEKTRSQVWIEVTIIGIAVLTLVGTILALGNPQTKFVVAAFLFAGALWLAISGASDFRSKAPNTSGTLSQSEKPTLEGEEDPELLRSMGYQESKRYLGRWERESQDADAQFDELDIIVYEDGNWLVSGSVYIVLNECAWSPGSAKSFQHRSTGACSLETLLGNAKFKQKILEARHLVFVGLESHLNAPQPANEEDECGHEWLTQCRSIEMATRVRNSLSKELRDNSHYWELDIGFAQEEMAVSEWDQRRAILLGVRNRREGLAPDAAIARISKETIVNDVRFEDYSKIDKATARKLKWKSGQGKTGHTK